MCSSVGEMVQTFSPKPMKEWKMMWGMNIIFKHICETRDNKAIDEFITECRSFLPLGELKATYAVPKKLADKHQVHYQHWQYQKAMDQGCVVK